MHYLCRKCATRLGSPEELAKHDIEAHSDIEVEVVLNSQGDDFIPLDRVDDELAELLKGNGFNTYKDLINATQKQLTAIKGIGDATAKVIKESAIELSGGGEDASDEQGADTIDEEIQEDT